MMKNDRIIFFFVAPYFFSIHFPVQRDANLGMTKCIFQPKIDAIRYDVYASSKVHFHIYYNCCLAYLILC